MNEAAITLPFMSVKEAVSPECEPFRARTVPKEHVPSGLATVVKSRLASDMLPSLSAPDGVRPVMVTESARTKELLQPARRSVAVYEPAHIGAPVHETDAVNGDGVWIRRSAPKCTSPKAPAMPGTARTLIANHWNARMQPTS
ncbi:MAG TPA: hypothetical protein VLT89_10010 [Usitatibacter sp.]|nr:hypothetical protein [Usitatibacter sp.]